MNSNSLLTFCEKRHILFNNEFGFIFFEGAIFMQRLKEEIRQKIIDMGKKRFETMGYENTSMKEIASDVGISTGNIYRYFLTKKHLLQEILVELQEEIEAFFSNIPSTYQEITQYPLFEKLNEFTIKIATERKDTLKILFQSQQESQFLAFKEKILAVLNQKLVAIVKSVKKKKPENATLCEAISHAYFEGFTYLVKCHWEQVDVMEKQLKMFEKLMIEDMGKKIMEVMK